MTTLKLIPARALGLLDDPDPVRDELPAREAFDVIEDCANCTANAATVAVLRAEVARQRREIDALRALLADADKALGMLGLAADGANREPIRNALGACGDCGAERLTLAERTAILEADANGEET